MIYCYQYIKTQNKKEIVYICKQGQFLKKFKDAEHFFENVGQSRSTIYFKVSFYKLLKRYCFLKKSALQSSYFNTSI